VKRLPPTDFELLRAIYERHRGEFLHRPDSRATKIFVPLDVPEIARKLGVDPNSVVGRLRSETKPTASNFPLLEAVLAGIGEQRRRDLLAIGTAAFSLVIAFASLIVAVLTA
jgi:hypothetical protein